MDPDVGRYLISKDQVKSLQKLMVKGLTSSKAKKLSEAVTLNFELPPLYVVSSWTTRRKEDYLISMLIKERKFLTKIGGLHSSKC